jgi:Fe2+ or Zn2+ uptake regulation protein
MDLTPSSILKTFGLRDSAARRSVLAALLQTKKPLSHKEMHALLLENGDAINLVTVYRTIDTFLERGVIHRHHSSGGFVLCSLREEGGHHGFLSCEKCGKVEEFTSPALCREEMHIATNAGFSLKSHVNEVSGICARCA